MLQREIEVVRWFVMASRWRCFSRIYRADSFLFALCPGGCRSCLGGGNEKFSDWEREVHTVSHRLHRWFLHFSG